LGKEDVLDRLVVSLFQLAIAIEIEKLVNPILMIVNSC
jgi:hypothetical protein